MMGIVYGGPGVGPRPSIRFPPLDGENRNIVQALAALGEPLLIELRLGDGFLRPLPGELADDLVQALAPVQLILVVEALVDAVGIYEEEIAGVQYGFLLGVAVVLEHAQEKAPAHLQ